MHVSSEHDDGDRILHVARLGSPRKLGPHDGEARTTLRAVSGLVLAAQSCREDQDSDVKWGRGWLSPCLCKAAAPKGPAFSFLNYLSGGGLAGDESQLHPLEAHSLGTPALERASSAWAQLRKSGAPRHIGRKSGDMSRSGDRTVKQGARRGRT